MVVIVVVVVVVVVAVLVVQHTKLLPITSPDINIYRPDALPASQPTTSKHWVRQWKKVWKSVNIWWSCGQEFDVLFFLTHSVVVVLLWCCIAVHLHADDSAGQPGRILRHQHAHTSLILLLLKTTMKQWRRQGEGRGSFPQWVDVQKFCNMCVLSLSWNFFVSHDKYIARPSSKEPRWYTDNTSGTGGLRTLDPL